MKTLLTLFVLLFSSSLFAEDISDFEIEGMSIGDSALDYFSEKKISSLPKHFHRKSRKFFYVIIGPEKKFKVYDKVILNFKANDKNYKIYALSGVFDYPNSIKQCYKSMRLCPVLFDIRIIIITSFKFCKIT